MKGLCSLFGASTQAYYKHSDDCLFKASRARFIVEYVQSIRQIDKGIGGEKLWYMYKDYFGQKYSVGRDAFLMILSQHGLTLRKSRKSCRTTNSEHGLPLYPDLIKHLWIVRPNQVWVSDITYIRLLSDDFCFLSLITDAYSHEIIGYQVGPTLETVHTLKALEQASKRISINAIEVIHHSDRGVQYASYMYTNELKRQGIKISMTENGDPRENAIAERVNGILKHEFLNHYEFGTIEEVIQAVEGAVTFYNTQRPHRSIDMLTPQKAALTEGKLPKRWVSHKDRYIQNSQP